MRFTLILGTANVISSIVVDFQRSDMIIWSGWCYDNWLVLHYYYYYRPVCMTDKTVVGWWNWQLIGWNNNYIVATDHQYRSHIRATYRAWPLWYWSGWVGLWLCSVALKGGFLFNSRSLAGLANNVLILLFWRWLRCDNHWWPPTNFFMIINTWSTRFKLCRFTWPVGMNCKYNYEVD